ncbi:hypothetical protein GCM10010353_67270 [Streptomyces chryseus]|nr:hypothetical protein GCM10010353_67270 [Streptomyces chryseus]
MLVRAGSRQPAPSVGPAPPARRLLAEETGPHTDFLLAATGGAPAEAAPSPLAPRPLARLAHRPTAFRPRPTGAALTLRTNGCLPGAVARLRRVRRHRTP